MYDPHAFHLFDLNGHESIYDLIHGLKPYDLQESFYYEIVHRGESYYRQGLVQEVKIHPQEITAIVAGSQNYHSRFYTEGDQIYGRCDCPYDGPCKHLAALAYFIILEPKSSLPILTPGKIKAQESQRDEYLNKLSKEELLDLVKQFAPPDYWEALFLKAASTENKKSTLDKFEHQIQRLFSEDHYDPTHFETKLHEILEKIRPLWEDFPEAIAAIFVQIIEKVEEAFEEGFLYNHRRDEYFTAENFNQYMAVFFVALKQPQFEKLLPIVWEASFSGAYTTFDNFSLYLLIQWNEKQKPPIWLKETILSQELFHDLHDHQSFELLYECIEPCLLPKEKLAFLKSIGDKNYAFALLYIKALMKANKEKAAIAYLDQKIETAAQASWYDPQVQDLFEFRIQWLAEKGDKKNLEVWCMSYLQKVKTGHSLSFILKYLPKQKSNLERTLKNAEPIAFIEYLDNQNRPEEIPAIFDQIPDSWEIQDKKLKFYQEHKALFPDRALNIFYENLDKNLEPTDNFHYQKVVNFLKQIREIEEPENFHRLIQQIKTDYKRRRNLMQLLKKNDL